MSTRSHIGKKLEDGTIKYIYCHFDGYLEHNGKILKEHYTNEAKVDALLELGDISILGPEIGEEQDFDRRETHHKDWCLAYGRDRGDTDIKAKVVKSTEDYSYPDVVSYCYLFDGGQWRCFGYGGELKF